MIEYDYGHRILNIGERVRVQARNSTDRNIKWKFGKIIGKKEELTYKIFMDNGVFRPPNFKNKIRGGNWYIGIN